MSEFSGHNYYNNAIKVDFIHKTVKFNPVIDGGFISHWFDVLLTLWLSSLFFSFLCFFIVALIGVLFDLSIDILIPICLLAVIVLPFIVSFFFSFGFLNKRWRENSFPEFNAQMSEFMSKIFGHSSKTFKTINSDAIVNNCFFVPIVSNVVFEYEATLDFAFYLESIDVINRFVGDDGDWFIVIRWSEKPIEGMMKIAYE